MMTPVSRERPARMLLTLVTNVLNYIGAFFGRQKLQLDDRLRSRDLNETNEISTDILKFCIFAADTNCILILMLRESELSA